MRIAASLLALALSGAALAQTPMQAPGAPLTAPNPPGFTAPPMAQPPAAAVSADHSETTVERKGRAGRDLFVGAYITVDRACKVGETPKIDFTIPPKSGKARTRRDPMNLAGAPGIPRNKCLGTSPAAISVVYQGGRFKGEDTFTYKVTYPDGRTRDVKATVTLQ